MRTKFTILSVTLVAVLLFSLNLNSLNKVNLQKSKIKPYKSQNVMVYIKSAGDDINKMGDIFQAMYALLNQSIEIKKYRNKESVMISRSKIKNSQSAIEAKKEEIEKEIEAAKDQFNTSCVLAVAKCVASIVGVASINSASENEPEIPSLIYLSNYRLKLKETLSKFLRLNKSIRNLLKTKKEYPYTSRQKQKIKRLIIKFDKLKYHLDKLRKRNKYYYKKLKYRKYKINKD